MDFVAITVEALKALSMITGGSYGLAIIVLTVAMRLVMWPLNVSQQKSMKQMQTLQPKLKELQERYKSNPQMLQTKMMEFYKEHNFNPMGGCLPLAMQMPIFILLYAALMSPQFIQVAGDSSFLFVKRLDATMRSHAGVEHDGKFGVDKKDIFWADKNALVTFNSGDTKEVKIDNPKKAIQIQGELIPGEAVDFKIDLDNLNLKFSELDSIESALIPVSNNGTKEVEKVDFTREGSILKASVPTVKVETTYHYDVLLLIALFGLTMYLSQKIIMGANKGQKLDATQEMMQKSMGKMMPIMVTGMFVFIPIPAGVLLYMVVSNIIQVVQTLVINKQMEAEESLTKSGVVKGDINAKQTNAKEVKKVTKQ